MEKVKELYDKEPLTRQRRLLEGLTKNTRNVEIRLKMKSRNLSYCYCRQLGSEEVIPIGQDDTGGDSYTERRLERGMDRS